MCKKTHLGRMFFLISLMLVSHVTHAESAVTLDKEMAYPKEAWDENNKKYLEPMEIWARDDWRQSIVIPNPPSLEETAKEIEVLKTLQPLREKHQADIDHEIERVGFAEKFFILLNATPETHPDLSSLVDKVLEDTTFVVFYFKNHFNRARPYHYYPDINPTIKPPGHPAYPSGHATQSYTLALVLAEIFPERKDELMELAYKIATNREIAGVHYKSDSEAGKIAATQLVEQMKAIPEFIDWANFAAKESGLGPLGLE